MTKHATSKGIGFVDTSVAHEQTLTDGSFHPTRTRLSLSLARALAGAGCSAAIASTMLSGLLLGPTAARANCTTDGQTKTETCSGSDIPNLINVSGGDATTYIYDQVTDNFGHPRRATPIMHSAMMTKHPLERTARISKTRRTATQATMDPVPST